MSVDVSVCRMVPSYFMAYHRKNSYFLVARLSIATCFSGIFRSINRAVAVLSKMNRSGWRVSRFDILSLDMKSKLICHTCPRNCPRNYRRKFHTKVVERGTPSGNRILDHSLSTRCAPRGVGGAFYMRWFTFIWGI